jgi:RNA polymerase sigma-70 factor (ECF subfamily)
VGADKLPRMQGEPQSDDRAAPVVAPDDNALCLALARGDRAALAALYDRHAPLLLALGVRMLDSRPLAEDVLHDVFVEAWHHARDFDPARGSARAWLVTRMRSRCLDRRATASRQARMASELAQEADAPSRGQPGQALDSARLHGQIAGLPAELAQIIELAYFDGLSSSAMARRLDIPVGTVKSRMARALSLLREGLGARGGDGS